MKLVNFSICLLFSALSGICTQAQQITKNPKPTIYIDIFREHDTNFYFWKLKYNHPYSVRLHNVNKLVYTGTKSDQAGTNLFTSIPTAFTGVKLPAFSTNPIKLNQPKKAGYVKMKEGQNNYETKPCICDSPNIFIKNDSDLNKIYSKLNDSLIYIKKLASSYNSLSQIQDSLTALKQDVISSWDSGINNVKTRKENILKRFQDTIHDTNQMSFVNGYKKIIINSDSLSKSIEKLVDNISNSLNKHLAKLICIDTINLVRRLTCFDPCKNKFFYIKLDSLIKIRECVLMYTKKIESMKEDVTMAKQIVTEMRTIDKDAKLQTVQKDYDLISKENYNYTVDAFIADKDVHDVTITISSPNPVGNEQPQNRIIHLKGITTGGIKVDFSTGVFFNFGNNNFLGPDYYYKKIDSVNKQVIESERTKKTMFSIGALAHFYWRTYSFIKPALSIGVSTTTTFETLNLHGGISLLFGNPGSPNRFIITGGVTLREVSLLDQRYQLNTNYPDLPDAVPVSKNFPKYGGFFAITYNIFSSASK